MLSIIKLMKLIRFIRTHKNRNSTVNALLMQMGKIATLLTILVMLNSNYNYCLLSKGMIIIHEL